MKLAWPIEVTSCHRPMWSLWPDPTQPRDQRRASHSNAGLNLGQRHEGEPAEMGATIAIATSNGLLFRSLPSLRSLIPPLQIRHRKMAETG